MKAMYLGVCVLAHERRVLRPGFSAVTLSGRGWACVSTLIYPRL